MVLDKERCTSESRTQGKIETIHVIGNRIVNAKEIQDMQNRYEIGNLLHFLFTKLKAAGKSNVQDNFYIH